MEGMREKHICPIRGCHHGVTWDKLMCQRHWHMVSNPTQRELYFWWQNRPDGAEHKAACKKAVDEVNAKMPSPLPSM